MKKYLAFLLSGLLMFAVSSKVLSQSTIMIDNPEANPVKVKVVNQPVASQTKTVFTEESPAGTAMGTIRVTAAAGETKVIEFVMAFGNSVNAIKITRGTRVYRIYMTGYGTSNYIYSGPLNIVVNSGTSVEFMLEKFGTSQPPTDDRTIFVSGYTLK